LLSCAPGITAECLSVLMTLRIEVLRDLEAGEADVVLLRIRRQKFHVDVDGNELDIVGVLSNGSDFLLAEGVQAILLIRSSSVPFPIRENTNNVQIHLSHKP